MFTTIKQSKNSRARIGKIDFDGVSVTTPTFMPVGTRGSVKGLTPEQVRGTGAGIVLGNTYHLHLLPGEDVVEKAGGLASFTKWKGPMLTDSGGFQVFSLGKINIITDEGVTFVNPANGNKVFLSPEISMQIQHKLGADIIMAFDDVVGLTTEDRDRTPEAFERTHRWLERSIAEHKRLSVENPKKPMLFGIVQGGLNKELRAESLKRVQSLDVDGIAIGGLSVGESREEMHNMLEFLAPLYDNSERPRYLMGVGHPTDMRFAIEHGIDMFDCVLPTRNARHGSVWFAREDVPDEILVKINSEDLDIQVNLKQSYFENDFTTMPGDSETAKVGYTKSFLRHMIRSREALGGTLLSIYNLRYLQALCEEYQKDITNE